MHIWTEAKCTSCSISRWHFTLCATQRIIITSCACRFASWYGLHQAGHLPVAKPFTSVVLGTLRYTLTRLLFLASHLGIGYGEETLSIASILKHKVPHETPTPPFTGAQALLACCCCMLQQFPALQQVQTSCDQSLHLPPPAHVLDYLPGEGRSLVSADKQM